jgi:hypothetical protein
VSGCRPTVVATDGHQFAAEDRAVSGMPWRKSCEGLGRMEMSTTMTVVSPALLFIGLLLTSLLRNGFRR